MLRVLLLGWTLAACGREAEPPPPRSDPPSAKSRSPTPSGPMSDGGVAQPTSAPPASAPATPCADCVDLLHALPSTVAVSSTLANPRLGPDKLVDGDLATAWNSRTGDLVGGWIAFQVGGPFTEILDVALTVGFTREPGREDLFTANPRIARVRVSRGRERLGEVDLDVGSRALQSLPFVGSGGGFWTIEVVRIVPGTHASWRELCVTELRVRGRSPDARPGAHTPTIQIGLEAPADAGPAAIAADSAPPLGPPASAAEIAQARRALRATPGAIEAAENAVMRADERGQRHKNRLEAELANAEHARDVAKGTLALAVCGATTIHRRDWDEARAASDRAYSELLRAAAAYDADPNDPSEYEAGEHGQAKAAADASISPLVDALDAILQDCPVDDPDLAEP